MSLGGIVRPDTPDPPERVATAGSFRRLSWLAGLVVLTAAFVIPRTVPSMHGDRGVFVSVAERLLAGDRLYVDVWDNKDPAFYYVVALGRALSPYADVVIELAWLAIASAAVVVIGRALRLPMQLAIAVGMAMTPVVLTGIGYAAGHTHLPGTALALAAMALTLRGSGVTAGVSLTLLALTKLVMLPIGIALVVTQCRGNRTLLGRLTLGALGGGAAAAVLLTARGELGPYVDAQIINVGYANGALLDYSPSPLYAHLERVFDQAGQQTVIAVTVVLFIAARSSLRDREDRAPAGLWWATCSSLLLGLAVIAATGLFPHHAQVLGPAAALACLLSALMVARSATDAGPATLALLMGIALLLADLPFVGSELREIKGSPAAVAALAQPTDVSRALVASGTPTTYARVGTNDDLGHAVGLREWALACPRFHQYPFDPADVLHQTLSCLPSAEVIVVSSRATSTGGTFPVWDGYIADVEALVRHDYTCTPVGADRICRRR